MSWQMPLDDDAIRTMLEARADRAETGRIDLHDVVAGAGSRAKRPLLGPRISWPLGLAGGGAVVALLAVALVAGPLVGRPGSSAAPTPIATAADSGVAVGISGSPTAGSPRPTPAPLELLTAAEAGDLIRTESATHGGALIVVRGRLETAATVICDATKKACGATVLADAGSTIMIRPVGDIGRGPWDGSGPLAGSLILRLNARPENGFPVAEFVGLLTTPPTGGPAWFVQDVLGGSVGPEGTYAAVQGWVVRDPVHPCPSDPRNPIVTYGCPTDDWLSEDEYQPLQPDGSTLGPAAAISLSSGSYDRWALDPAAGGPGGRGVEPRGAIYLLWFVSDGCGPNADCAAPPPRWRIVGRFDPIERVAGTAPSPDPIVATDGRVPPPDGDAWTVAQLLDRPVGPGTFLVRGWLVATPFLRCRDTPAPSGVPDYGCDEVDWLTDRAFQPWVSSGSGGGTREPAVGLRVQNGAYMGFAPSPGSASGGGLAPRFGEWIVRETNQGYPCSPDRLCRLPEIRWEVLARLP